MIKVEFIRDVIGHKVGDVMEYPDKDSGLIRAWVADGRCRKVTEKVEKLPAKEKVETAQAPKTIKKKVK